MALNPDDYFGDTAAPKAPAARRYAPAPTTPEGVDERLADVAAAEEEIRAWAESKRLKKGGGPASKRETASPPSEAFGDAQPPKAPKAINPDDYFDAAPEPVPPKPGLLQRAQNALQEIADRPKPDASRITPEQARGMLQNGMLGAQPDEAQAEQPPKGITGLLAKPGRDPRADPMLRPEFVGRLRERLRDVPPEGRIPALQEIAKSHTAEGRAAQQLLRQAEAENARIRPEDEATARRIGEVPRAPQGGGAPGAQRAPVALPDPTPNIGDTMDGAGAAEVAQRRETAGNVADAGRPTMRDARAEKLGALDRKVDAQTPGILEEALGPVLNDKIVALVKVLPTAQSFALGAANFVTGGALDTPVEGVQKLNEFLDTFKSRKAREVAEQFARIASDENLGVVDALAFLATQPSALTDSVIENIGAVFVGGAGGTAAVRGSEALARKLVGKGASEAERLAKSKGFLGSAALDINKAKAEVNALRARIATAGAGASDALMGAGIVFSDPEMRDKPVSERFLAGVNAAIGYAALAKLTGAGASGELARRGVGQKTKGGLPVETLRATGREGIEEYGQSFAEEGGKALATGDDFDLNKTAKQGTMDLLAGGLTGASVHLGGTAKDGLSLRARDLTDFMAPKADMPPTEVRAQALKRFDEAAAAFGINPQAVARAKKAAGEMPAGEVPAFLAKLTDSLSQKGLVAKPIDAEAMQQLRAAVEPVQQAEQADRSDQMPGEPAGMAEPAAQPAAPAAEDFTGLDETIDTAAHVAATSPLNARPEPTDAQKEAGNYAKGHVRISGLDVSIENPKGSVRRSKADAAEPWEVVMPAHYGYIRGTRGSDGDHVDLFIGDKGDNGNFWVINQTKPDGKTIDEHKVVTGVDSATEAIDLYRRSFADGYGDKLIGSVSQRLDADQLKATLPSMEKPQAIHATAEKAPDAPQPDVAVPSAEVAGAGDGRGDQPRGSGGAVGLVPAAPGRVDRPAEAPEGRREPAAAVAAPDKPDAALTRTIGRVGRTPSNAEPVELRANLDGTLTPHMGADPMLDFESGEPIVIPAGATDAQAAEAIRQAGAIGNRSKFFGVKEDAAESAEPAKPAQTPEQQAAATEARVVNLKSLLKCLMS